ncbi:Glycerophosphoryl diester phosphodiesterase family protein [Coccidioides posadasii C735 delta SOWgp]|uniref:Glycerophosphoryl diester phosphodiesterase family protein n=1 Tax=Coccidioides posadasii (strain C735) TaxID=222929 RepID=C5PAX2_COCP7|nr:Glycerophosphoryl diester phosphodiesterase family protein [Coccidioides posadasii C735 delta SOWgp]EER25756.1 Glycerophosphoryl diester phosphodiesterase family protein [Coccidioides posadasii C735 delta SOWgp]|eukprot:XP_003067901.1 Glycerophosphoryl diester phosphodiesterase family protein [Coccidioides posadasii C735 delta SOWgp]
MKFGQNFHRHQIREWAPYYARYNHIKALIKASQPGGSPSQEESYEYLESDINVFKTFHQLLYSFLEHQERALCSTYGLRFPVLTIPDLASLHECEPRHILESILELQADLARLQWYDRVNGEALSRLCDKLEKINGGNSPRRLLVDVQPTFDAQCNSDGERLRSLEKDITRSLRDRKAQAPLRSLFLSKAKFPFAIYPEHVLTAIVGDRDTVLSELLAQYSTRDRIEYSEMLELLMQFCTVSQSRKCFEILITELGSKGPFMINSGFLNRYIASLGRERISKSRIDEQASDNGIRGDADNSLCLIMRDMIESGQIEKSCLRIVDFRGRLPLHYAAIHGIYPFAMVLLPDTPLHIEEALLLKDCEGHTPLNLAVIYGHTAIVKLFLQALKITNQADQKIKDTLAHLLGDILLIALKCQHDHIVSLLSWAQSHVDCHSNQGKTALHVAVQIGRTDYVKIILQAMSHSMASIDVAETTRGWTPLILACIMGHLEIVEILLQAKASHTMVDRRGWTAKEHAAFRGHLHIANLLPTHESLGPFGGPSNLQPDTVSSSFMTKGDESCLVLNLGPMQTNKQMAAVALNFDPTSHPESFSIEVSLPGGPSYLLQLPILDDASNPLLFPVGKSATPQIIFKLFRGVGTGGQKGPLVGGGTALLENACHSCTPDRESLIRTRSISIMSKNTLDFIGTVSFTYVIAKPYASTGRPPAQLIPISNSVQLVGHRGFGQNTAERDYLQLGENTVEVGQSCLSAKTMGASLVEVNVQVTRDLVPIIYHDFSLSESGTDVPIHDVSLNQFLYSGKSALLDDLVRSLPNDRACQRNPRSQSLTRYDDKFASANYRLQHTVDFMKKGFKPNSQGTSIQSPFATLEDLLIKLPKDLGFVIELKYPRPHEAADASVAPVAIEVNAFIDVILDKIHRFGAGRNIVLASFTPEICILLSRKARGYPIMFITNAGKRPITDMEKRGASLQVAIQFARQWNFTGVVLAAETFLLCPRLIQYVQRSGLLCASYGLVNNVPENAKVQVDAGIDMLIVDRVGLIAKALASTQEVVNRN